MKHCFTHILGCLLPIGLIFLLPALGISSEISFVAFLIIMLGCCLYGKISHKYKGGNARDADMLSSPNHTTNSTSNIERQRS